MDGTTLTIAYDRALRATSPVDSAGQPVFDVAVTGGSAFTVSGVVAGVGPRRNMVSMTLDPSAQAGQTVTVSYRADDATRASKVQDEVRNPAASLDAMAVRNATTMAGAPAITVSNAYRVPAVLGVDLSDITDSDGFGNLAATATYEWVRVDRGRGTVLRSGAANTYRLTRADAGKKIKVRVRFTDDANNREGPVESALTPRIDGASRCRAPSLSGGAAILDDRRILTLGASGMPGSRTIGYTSALGALDDRTFSVGATAFSIDRLVTAGAAGSFSLALELDTAVPAAMRPTLSLYVCDRAFHFQDAAFSAGGRVATWQSSGLDWTGEAERSVYLVRDATAPRLVDAFVDRSVVKLVYDEAIAQVDTSLIASQTAFRVRVDGVAETPNVAIQGAVLTLDLDAPVTSAQTVTVSYTPPSGADQRLQDAFGNTVAALANRAVRNITAPPIASAGAGLVGNLSQRIRGGRRMQWFDHSQRFTTGPNPTGYTVTSIDVGLWNVYRNDNFPTVTLHRGHNRGRRVATLRKPTSGAVSGAGRSTATPPMTAFTLNPNTKYWLVFQGGTSSVSSTRYLGEDPGSAAGWRIQDWTERRYADSSGHFSPPAALQALDAHARQRGGEPGAGLRRLQHAGDLVRHAPCRRIFEQRGRQSRLPAQPAPWRSVSERLRLARHDGSLQHSPSGCGQHADRGLRARCRRRRAERRSSRARPFQVAARGGRRPAVLRHQQSPREQDLPVRRCRALVVRRAVGPGQAAGQPRGDRRPGDRRDPRRLAHTVRATVAGIADPGGVPGRFDYQWMRVDGGTAAEIVGATSATYTLTPDDVGKTIQVNVSFLDGDGFPEERTSPESATVADRTVPALTDAAVSLKTLTLTYDEDLDSNSTPAKEQFTVKTNGIAKSLASTGAVAVSGATVTLTLADVVHTGAVVTVSYAVPGTDPLQDAAGNDAEPFTDEVATNSTADAVPELLSAAVNGTAVTLTYDESLDTSKVPARTAFGVRVVNADRELATMNAVAINGTEVTLTLSSAAGFGEAVRVSYTPPSSNALQDSDGNLAESFTAVAAANRTPHPGGTHCTGAPEEIWCARVRVGSGDVGGDTEFGFVSGSPGIGSLDVTGFSYSGTTYAVGRITYTSGTLQLSTTPAVGGGLRGE